MHTKEPWIGRINGKYNGDHEYSIDCDDSRTSAAAPIWADGKVIAFVVTNEWGDDEMDANAVRMVSCVNALADLNQEALDGGWNYKDQNAYTVKLEQQRDELLAALKAVVRIADRDTDEFIAARSAIAKAEGKGDE